MADISGDKIRSAFLLNIHKIIEQNFIESKARIQQKKEQFISVSQNSFQCCLENLCCKYKQLQELGELEEMRYVYISFLRSSILDQAGWYQMDAYDTRGLASLKECAEKWDFICITSEMYEIVNLIQAEFKKQTFVKEYEIDYIQYHLAERFHQEYKDFIYEILERVLYENGKKLFDYNHVYFMLGEYLDKSQFILGWNGETIINEEDYKKLEEDKWEEGILNE